MRQAYDYWQDQPGVHINVRTLAETETTHKAQTQKTQKTAAYAPLFLRQGFNAALSLKAHKTKQLLHNRAMYISKKLLQ